VTPRPRRQLGIKSMNQERSFRRKKNKAGACEIEGRPNWNGQNPAVRDQPRPAVGRSGPYMASRIFAMARQPRNVGKKDNGGSKDLANSKSASASTLPRQEQSGRTMWKPEVAKKGPADGPTMGRAEEQRKITKKRETGIAEISSSVKHSLVKKRPK